jgi:hypothetical protein
MGHQHHGTTAPRPTRPYHVLGCQQCISQDEEASHLLIGTDGPVQLRRTLQGAITHRGAPEGIRAMTGYNHNTPGVEAPVQEGGSGGGGGQDRASHACWLDRHAATPPYMAMHSSCNTNVAQHTPLMLS